MNSGKTIFAQLMDFIPSAYQFRCCVERYNGHYKVKSFSCWDQFLTLAFAQLTFRESLRDIEACLRTTPQKLYHMGIRSAVSRNTLANANQVRDWRIYAEFAQILIQEARSLYQGDSFGVDLDNTSTHWTLPPSICACRFSRGRSFAAANPLSNFTLCSICVAVSPRW